MSESPTVSPAQAPESTENDHSKSQQDAEFREAYDYWGYLFKPDKTGTDNLKALLTGMKLAIVRKYEPSESNDITPSQLAHFYREVHGNYDQLFLGTPHESIAFIYKSLGCLHSLQPQASSQTTAFTDPTVPALKTEGWVMWQTIQLLLGPDEHAEFLCEAVRKWDIKNPVTGEVFPKILPRQCFPPEPDKHMVAWYEGVSERLRQEADEEAKQKELEATKADVRRIRSKPHNEPQDIDDGASIDSRATAIAYFQNPLYRRNNDGRPSIGQKRRPGISPRPTFVDKGKEAAARVGQVVRNVGSPHLWDGRGSRSASHDRDREKDRNRERERERRRRSIPDHAFSPADNDGGMAQPNQPSGPAPRYHRRHSSQHDHTNGPSPRDEGYAPPDDNTDPSYSPHPSTQSRRSRRSSHETSLRRPHSHEPTPSQKEQGGDYFEGYDRVESRHRRSSTQGSAASPALSGGGGPGAGGAGGLGAGFGPSASPLFATQVAHRPQVASSHRQPSADYGLQPTNSTSRRRPPSRTYSRSPDRRDHHSRRPSHGQRLRPSDGSRRPHFEHSNGYDDNYDDGEVRRPHSRPRSTRPRDDDESGVRRPHSRSRSGRIRDDYDYDNPEPDSPHVRPNSHSRSRRGDGSDVSASGPAEGDRERLPTRGKHARFGPDPSPAVAGVDGRRYPNEMPWR